VTVDHFVATYGYVAVLAFIGVESFGVPLPGETALIAAGVLAGHTHQLSPWLLWPTASAAALAGGIIGYVLGVKGGYRLVRRYGHALRINEPRLKVARYAFDRHGAKIVFVGRFVVVLRTYAAFLAGTSRMRWWRFLPANVAGAVAWAGLWTWVSYEAGNGLRRASGTIDLVLAGAAVVVLVGVVVFVRSRFDDLRTKAEAAYPGPLED
jgi:membrane protein DedA with SNARE-associated domain